MTTTVYVQGRVTFEKLTHMDYPGTTYFSIRNVSLYECQRWCRDEVNCVSAVFSFVVNPLAPVQDTMCSLQNMTTSVKPDVLPQRSVNTYFFTKVQISSERVCNRLWSFERIPNTFLRGLDNAIFYTSTKEICLAACLNEARFLCRSVEFDYVRLECHLSEYDRRSPVANVALVEKPTTDYFENACLQPEEICRTGGRSYEYVHTDLPQLSVAHFVGLYYYSDKELVVNTQEECLQTCNQEKEFICRSFLYSPETRYGQPNCALYHVDYVTMPDGKQTFLNPSPIPLLDIGERTGRYLEAVCTNSSFRHQVRDNENPVFKIPPSIGTGAQRISNSPLVTHDGGDPSCDDYGFCYNVSIQCTDTKMVVFVSTNKPFHGRIYALGRSETCQASVNNGNQFDLNVSLKGQDCNTKSVGGVFTNTVVLQHHSIVMTKSDKVYNIRCTYETSSKNVSFGMMPVRDPDTAHVTGAPEAPLPSIHILAQSGREATTVRIGDQLNFRIEIPQNTPYGIFARSCIAMAKDGKSVFKIIDSDGCPVDKSIFPQFVQVDEGLESTFEAFRFTESYGVIFQCNVRYCIGKCEPVSCVEGKEEYMSWGRRKRDLRSEKDSKDMTLSHEIFVLDYGDETIASLRDVSQGLNATYDIPESISIQDCASRTSVMVLSVISATLLVIYICTVAYFVAQKRVFKELP
ncbi:uncharacterized protein LOC143248099 [Tachypleus tridentatus]|uniref:uncharacterized protein LOC143248099 n=1 Tax=Tachypleus tridentatus TaxID=6853 RepID=UPI003FD2D5C8